MNKKYVLVCDICSSTKIIENLVSNGQEENYRDLIDNLIDVINQSSIQKELYKFLGDGFLILFEEDVEPNQIMKMIQNISTKMNNLLKQFINDYVDQDIDKIGMTFGLAFGPIHKVKLKEFSNEYFGRPINLASRMQASVIDANTVLVQNDVYRRITDKELKSISVETKREFKNISGILRCYLIPCLSNDVLSSRITKNEEIDQSKVIYKNVVLTKMDKQILNLILSKKSAREICLILGIGALTFSRSKVKLFNLFNVNSGELLAEEIKSIPKEDYKLITGISST